MRDDWPVEIHEEAKRIETQIREAFHGVTREGGVSWSESVLVDSPGVGDDYDHDEELLKARAKDTDRSWEELVDDPTWWGCMGIGGFNFVDSIGFRYYFPVSLVRVTRTGSDAYDGVAFHLEIPSGDRPCSREFSLEKFSLFTEPQCRTVAAFLKFMNRLPPYWPGGCKGDEWDAALESYWKKYL